MKRSTKKDEHQGELTPEHKKMLSEPYEFVWEDRFKCVCGADVYVTWDEFRKEHVPKSHLPKPRPKPYNGGGRGGKRS